MKRREVGWNVQQFELKPGIPVAKLWKEWKRDMYGSIKIEEDEEKVDAVLYFGGTEVQKLYDQLPRIQRQEQISINQ